MKCSPLASVNSVTFFSNSFRSCAPRTRGSKNSTQRSGRIQIGSDDSLLSEVSTAVRRPWARRRLPCRSLDKKAASDDSKQLPATRGPQVGVSFRLFAGLRVRGVPRHQLFELGCRFDFVLHDHMIKLPGEVRHNAEIPEVPRICHVLQLSRQLACLPRLGDETVAHDNHSPASSRQIVPLPCGCVGSPVSRLRQALHVLHGAANTFHLHPKAPQHAAANSDPVHPMEIYGSGGAKGLSNCTSFSVLARSRRRRVCPGLLAGEDVKQIHKSTHSFRVVRACILRLIERVKKDFAQPPHSVHTGKTPLRSPRLPDRQSQSSGVRVHYSRLRGKPWQPCPIPSPSPVSPNARRAHFVGACFVDFRIRSTESIVFQLRVVAGAPKSSSICPR